MKSGWWGYRMGERMKVAHVPSRRERDMRSEVERPNLSMLLSV